MHWTYDENLSGDDQELRQGDILEPSDDLRKLFTEVHSHFVHEKYRGFLVLSQTCDLAKRHGKCKATHISLSVIRSLQDIISDSLKEHFGYFAPGIYNKQKQFSVEGLTERLINQNENALGLFYLHPDIDAGISVPSVAILRVSIAVRASEHYDKLVKARSGRLSTEFQPKLGWMVGNLYSRVGVADWKEKKSLETEDKGADEAYVISEILSFAKRDKPVWLDKKIFSKIKKDFPEFESLPCEEQDSIIKKYLPPPPMDEILNIVEKVVSNTVPKVKSSHLENLRTRLKNDELFTSKVRKFGRT